MKLVDEKKALQEIRTLKRARKVLETSGSSEDAIAADKARIEELKKKLDDPEAKKVSEKFDALKKEMDELRAEGDKAYQERNKLFDERTALSTKMVRNLACVTKVLQYSHFQDELYAKKREINQKFHDEKDKYYAKVQAIRQARQERYKAEKAKEEAARRDEEIARMREEAKAPAYGAEIEDCRILINYFAGKYGVGEVPETSAGASSSKEPQIAGVKQLEIRKVTDDFQGMTIKKKDEDLEGFFGGSGKGKKKGGKKGGANASANASGTATPTTSEASINLPMNLLSALLAFGIPPPTNKEDVARTVSDLETKKAWFEANSEAKTKSEIERVEKLVAKMQKKNAATEGDEEEGEYQRFRRGGDADSLQQPRRLSLRKPRRSRPSRGLAPGERGRRSKSVPSPLCGSLGNHHICLSIFIGPVRMNHVRAWD